MTRIIVAIAVSGTIGYLAAMGLYHITGSVFIELAVIPLALVNGYFAGRGASVR